MHSEHKEMRKIFTRWWKWVSKVEKSYKVFCFFILYLKYTWSRFALNIFQHPAQIEYFFAFFWFFTITLTGLLSIVSDLVCCLVLICAYSFNFQLVIFLFPTEFDPNRKSIYTGYVLLSQFIVTDWCRRIHWECCKWNEPVQRSDFVGAILPVCTHAHKCSYGYAPQLVAKLRRYTVTRPYIHLMCTLVLGRAGKCICRFFVLCKQHALHDDNEHHHRSAERFFMNGMFGMRTLVCVVRSKQSHDSHTFKTISNDCDQFQKELFSMKSNECVQWIELEIETIIDQNFLCLALFSFPFVFFLFLFKQKHSQ